MIRYDPARAALVSTDLRSVPTPWSVVVLTATTIVAALRWAYAAYVQDSLITQYGALIDDVLGNLPGIDTALVVTHPDRWSVVALVAALVLVVVLTLHTTQRARARRRFYAATDATPTERSIVDRLTSGFPALMRGHGIGTHTTVVAATRDDTVTRITPPILDRIEMGPSGLRLVVTPADGQTSYELAGQWDGHSKIFRSGRRRVKFSTEVVEGDDVHVQLYSRIGGMADVTNDDLGGDL